MSKAKTAGYDVTVEGGGHGMTTDPLDGLEQLRRISDEQPEPAPESVMLGLDYCYAEWVAERARHAEEVSALRDQLRKVEGERDALAVRMDLPASQLLMVGSELCGDGKIDPNDHRDPRWTPTLQQAAKVMRELTSLRALLPDVRACAEYCRNMIGPPPGIPVEDYPLPPVALAARRILAALDSHECPECHMVERCKMSCSRGGSKGARVSVSPREGGE